MSRTATHSRRRRIGRLCRLVALMLAAGCAHGPSWEGRWVVRYQEHALPSEATVFELAGSGRLHRGSTVGLPNALGPDGSTAWVVDPRTGVSCTFGERWRRRGTTLQVSGDCSDHRARWIALSLRSTQAVSGWEVYEVQSIVVDGQSGWLHGGRFGWRFERCPDAADEAASLRGPGASREDERDDPTTSARAGSTSTAYTRPSTPRRRIARLEPVLAAR